MQKIVIDPRDAMMAELFLNLEQCESSVASMLLAFCAGGVWLAKLCK